MFCALFTATIQRLSSQIQLGLQLVENPFFPESIAKGSSSTDGSLAHTTAPTPLTHTTPQSTQHLHRYNIYTADIHRATVYTCTTGPTPLIYTALQSIPTPRHLHRSHTPSHSPHGTYTARRHPTPFTHAFYFLSFLRPGLVCRESSGRTLCGFRACWSAPVVAPCEF